MSPRFCRFSASRRRNSIAIATALLCAGCGTSDTSHTKKQAEIVVWGISFGPETKGIEAVVRELRGEAGACPSTAVSAARTSAVMDAVLRDYRQAKR